MNCRKNYRDLTNVERDRFVQALHYLKSTGVIDQFANDHDTFFHEAHHSSHFLPWHREFLRRFEDALRTFHPNITIPYWNSTADTSPSDSLWDNTFLVLSQARSSEMFCTLVHECDLATTKDRIKIIPEQVA